MTMSSHMAGAAEIQTTNPLPRYLRQGTRQLSPLKLSGRERGVPACHRHPGTTRARDQPDSIGLPR